VETQRSRLAELREEIRRAKVEKEKLSEKIADTSTNPSQKQQAVRRYNIIVGDLKTMASDLEKAIDAIKHTMENRSR
jgi:chromosome segregation ATPase